MGIRSRLLHGVRDGVRRFAPFPPSAGMYICKNLGYVLNVAIVFTVSVVLWYLFGMNCIY